MMEEYSPANMAAKLNNEAVLRIVTFDYTAACDLLVNALQLVMERTKEDNSSSSSLRYSGQRQEMKLTSGAGPETGCEGNVRLESRLPIVPARNCLRSDGGPPPASHQHDADCTAASSCYYIYRKPIEIQELPSSGSFSSKDYILVLCQAIVFNLALAHHLTALNESAMSPSGTATSTSSREATLQKAIKLYQLSHTLLCQEAIGLYDSVYVLASLTNLAHIHHMVGNKRTAEQCCQHLLVCIMYVIECGGDEDKHVFQEFFPTVKHLILEDTHSAAGA